VRVFFAATILAAAVFLASCGKFQALKDGYYSAQFEDFDQFGWKEYITIFVSDGKVASVEYNARNPSGMIKSWDIEYMRVMNTSCGTYPNEYTRAYSSQLLEHQNAGDVDVISGATHSYDRFQMLAGAVLQRAEKGDGSVAERPPPDEY
jgi:major membrane immunogen (membrane-anchored lipoprotein)